MYGVPSLFTRLLQSKETRGARPVDVARAGLENGWEATRLTPAAKSLHLKDAAPAQHGVFQARRGNRCNSTGVIPGVPQVPS